QNAIRKILVSMPDARGQAILDCATQQFRNGELGIALEEEDWAHIRRIVPVMEAAQEKLAAAYAAPNFYPPTDFCPALAYGEARSGDFAAAHALIDRTPGDCDPCMRMRGRIDAMQKNYGGADFWFARAVKQSPSIPFAHYDWGRVLLNKGDAGGA